jgi:hypothetical protein
MVCANRCARTGIEQVWGSVCQASVNLARYLTAIIDVFQCAATMKSTPVVHVYALMVFTELTGYVIHVHKELVTISNSCYANHCVMKIVIISMENAIAISGIS